MPTAYADSLLREHVAGASYRQLGSRYGLGKTTVASLIQEALDDLVFQTTVDLYAAWRDEQATGVGHYPVFVIPAQNQALRAAALRLVELVRRRMRARGVPVKTVLRNVPANDESPGGSVWMLTLDQAENDRREAAKE
jgi:hypothetical protein